MPFVGEAGRSSLSGEIRPCDGDIASPRPSDFGSPGASSLWAGVKGSGEPMPLETLGLAWCDAFEPLPYAALLPDGEEERYTGSSIALSCSEDSLDIPGICIRDELEP